MAPPMNSTQREQILGLLASGIPKGEIASRVGVTKGQVAAILSRDTQSSMRRSPVKRMFRYWMSSLSSVVGFRLGPEKRRAISRSTIFYPCRSSRSPDSVIRRVGGVQTPRAAHLTIGSRKSPNWVRRART